jgi:hypothetical protein
MSNTSAISVIVERFGGIRPMAVALGLPASTVSSWKLVGRVPSHRIPTVVEAARKAGVKLSYSDFFDAPADAAE